MYIITPSTLGHKDSVTATGFSHDGKYIATADMSGFVQVWRVASGECVWTYECGTDLEVTIFTVILLLHMNFLVVAMAF